MEYDEADASGRVVFSRVVVEEGMKGDDTEHSLLRGGGRLGVCFVLSLIARWVVKTKDSRGFGPEATSVVR